MEILAKEQQSGWIKNVPFGLKPKDSLKAVLVTKTSGEVTKATKNQWGDDWSEECYWYEDGAITVGALELKDEQVKAWRPMPDPYKGRGRTEMKSPRKPSSELERHFKDLGSKPAPTLNKRESEILKELNDCWEEPLTIARDKNGELYAYDGWPTRNEESEEWTDPEAYNGPVKMAEEFEEDNFDAETGLFQFITWDSGIWDTFCMARYMTVV